MEASIQALRTWLSAPAAVTSAATSGAKLIDSQTLDLSAEGNTHLPLLMTGKPMLSHSSSFPKGLASWELSFGPSHRGHLVRHMFSCLLRKHPQVSPPLWGTHRSFRLATIET